MARQGDLLAKIQLRGPPIPASTRYLWNWYREIEIGKADSFSGPSRLTWETLESWCHLTDTSLLPHEAQALMFIDHTMRNPDAEK